ncbi:MAG: Lrp/AsnC family transcriptional regulator [Thaumarchaeota archaeon]|nr:Lrp/AsnC family transcriptional regulator [Nitrososphaerota archaeon]
MKKVDVLINCDLGKEEKILHEFRELKSKKEAHGTFGANDIIVEISTNEADSLRKEITWKIRNIALIRATLTQTSIEGVNYE